MIKYQLSMQKSIILNLFLSTLFLKFSLVAVLAQSPEPQKDFNNPKPASASVYNLGLKSYEQGDVESAIIFLYLFMFLALPLYIAPTESTTMMFLQPANLSRLAIP